MTTATAEPWTEKDGATPVRAVLPEFIVLGEAPGKVEDHVGEPFSGPVGRYLKTKLATCDILYSAVFMNTVSCWPAGNVVDDKPTALQSKACRGNLKAQLDLITESPFVLAVGTHALKAMVRHADTMKWAQGVWIPIHGKLVLPILHPGYILRVGDVVLERKWMGEINKFASAVKGYSLLAHEIEVFDFDPPWCIYCGGEIARVQYSDYKTCWGDRNKWRLDQAWDPSRSRKRKVHPDQGTLM